MRSFWHLVLAAVLCLECAGGVVRADETYALRGKVLSSVDGTPIRGVLVELKGPAQGNALTGNDGSFVFSKLAAGEFAVSARKQGYFASELGEPRGAVVVRVQLDAATPELSLSLIPEGIIYGKIVDEQGEPLDGLEVQARRRFAGNSEMIPVWEYTVTTNEAGEYRIVGLPSGSYYLLETPKKWTGNEATLFVARRRKSGIPTHFYPGVLESTQAAAIRVFPGSSQQINWRIAHQPLYQVSGRVQGKGGSENSLVGLVSSYSEQNLALALTGPDGSFVFHGVSAGEYEVVALLGEGEDPEKLNVAVKAITLKANVQDLVLQAFPRTRISVHFKEEYTHKSGGETADQSAPANVNFVRADIPDDLASKLSSRQSEWDAQKKEIQLWLEPGTFRIEITTPAKIYAASAISGNIDLLKEDLVVAPGSELEPLELVLRDDQASVTGTVRYDGKPAQARVVLLPEYSPRKAAIIAADAGGKFQAQSLVPGRYSLLALRNGTEIDLQDGATQRRIQSLGESVELQPNAQTSVELELKQWEE
ncbi:MAG TPA: carboxypeptidase-like regulatory domain-containing protein [Candidatus Limnocylindrales bacterium]|nr:carboxypeptidase-like regulatory domain-containing protein [Candidatus Limnocylindrales bacterium]